MHNQGKEISTISKVSAVVKTLFGTAAKKYPLFFVLESIRTIIQIVQPFLAVFLSPLIVDELVGERNIQRLALYAGVLILGEAILQVINGYIGNTLARYQERLDNYFSMLIGHRSMNLDFQLTENKETLDQLEKAKTGMTWYSGGAYGIAEQVFGMIGNIIKVVGFVAVIATKAPILLIIMLVYVVLQGFLTSSRNKVEIKAYKELSKVNRLFGYFGWNIVDINYGKDIRLYDASDMMVDCWKDNTEKSNTHWKWEADNTYFLSILTEILTAVRSLFAYFYVGLLAIRGAYSIGIFTQLVAAESSLDMTLGGLVGNVLELVKRCTYAYEYVLFMELPEAIPKGNMPIEKKTHVIEFKDVSFAYPGTEKKVLDKVNLRIEEGEHLALVGRNGAGKTTLIKLLCRLYDPTEGQILMDGKDIKEYDYKEYMRQFAPVFQDFKLFALSIKDNIDFGESTDASKVKELAKSVGLDEMVVKLEKGVDTNIYKYFDESGIEPSGGEQQKMAIARALYKDAPVVILDEPTSALDPTAEYEIYKDFNNLVGNRTAFYISHRLSSCKFCDHIAVFSGGTIKEYGNHDQLVNLPGGIYAEMFQAQAKYYVAS